jgi:tripartite-type tricarboxylate transporter receptor subunit TctC
MDRFGRWPLILTAAATVSGLLIGSVPATAQSVEQFYKSTTLTITIGHPPGGSYDLYARLAADYLKKFLPGGPTTIVQGRPGGGGVNAVAWLYAQARRDGSNLGLFPETIAHTQILQPEIGKWKVQEMHYIGSFAPVNAVFMIRKDAPAKTPQEMLKTTINVACTGRNSQSYQAPAALKELANFKFNLICGYPGSAEATLGLLRGETDMLSSAWNSWRATHRTEIQNGAIKPVIQVGLIRSKELPDVPLMQELVDDPKIKEALEFVSAGAAIGRALIAPPDVPADRLAALRVAFDQMVADPAFIKEAEKRNIELEPTAGAEVDKFSARIADAPKEAIEMAAKAMSE